MNVWRCSSHTYTRTMHNEVAYFGESGNIVSQYLRNVRTIMQRTNFDVVVSCSRK
jgi:hypothetical protein